MKTFCSLILIVSFHAGFSQSLPINFEGDINTEDFIDFDGGTATVLANPDPSGINTSSLVARIVRDGGPIFSGSKIPLAENLDFSVLTKITMKVYTTAPVGTTVKFKLEGSGPAAEVDAVTTVSGAWETLEWIFIGTENNLNELVFMFDFGNIGDGSASSTFYFDDIAQVQGPTPPVPASLPVDFEASIVDTDFLNYAGATATVIANPHIDEDNPSATVGQVVRDGGNFWAGSQLFLSNTLDLSTMWILSMKVYTSAPIGTRIKLELENSSGTVNFDQLTTVTNAWETISWNFNGQPNDYDKIQVMFDFGNIGDGSSTSTFLFDDLQQTTGEAIPEPTIATLPVDFEGSVVTTDFSNFFGAITTVVPNPQIDKNNPSATVGKFLRSGGAGFMRSKLTLTDYIQDMSTAGTLSMKVYTDAPVGSILKFKLESSPPALFGKEQDALTTVSGEWATYKWDLSNGDNPIYDVLTLMLGYNGANDASESATFYFDDIEVLSNTINLAPTAYDATFSIRENAPVETSVGMTSATDPENDLLTFSIVSGNELGTFQIDQITGELTVLTTASLDYETTPTFSLGLQVTDGELSGEATVTINLSDLDDTVLSVIASETHQIKLYPNPTTDFVNIEWTNFEQATVTDLTGKVLVKSSKRTIDLANQKSGLYLINLTGKNSEQRTIQIIKR